MSGSAPAEGPATDTLGWRPMAFGGRSPRSIRDPLIEPLWAGRRVLVGFDRTAPSGPSLASAAVGRDHLAQGRDTDVRGEPWIELRDEAGLGLAGHPALRLALALALRAEAAVIDGYLADVPAPTATHMFDSDLLEAPGLGAVSRQMLFGSRGSGTRSGPAMEVRAASHDAGPGDPVRRLSGATPGAPVRRRSGATPGAPVRRLSGAASDQPEDMPSLIFVAIDLLALDGDSLLDVPLLERKRLLDSVLTPGELVRRSMHVRPPASSWYRQWRALGFRKIALKGANSRYRPGASSPDWTTAPIPAR